MNISFKYDNGDKKIIVSNRNGELTEIDYVDNIEELLILANIIEILNIDIDNLQTIEEILITELQDLEQKVEEQKEEKKSVKKTAKVLFFCGTIIGTAGLTISSCLTNTMQIIQILKTLLVSAVVDGSFFAFLSIMFILMNKVLSSASGNPQVDLEAKRLELDIVQKNKEILSKALEKEKRKYKELQENQSRENELQMQNNNQITIVEYRAKLEQIKNEIKSIMEKEGIPELDNIASLALEKTMKSIMNRESV